MEKKDLYLLSKKTALIKDVEKNASVFYEIKKTDKIDGGLKNSVYLIDLTDADLSNTDNIEILNDPGLIEKYTDENNLALIAIIDNNQLSLSEKLLEYNFSDFIIYPFIDLSLRVSLRNVFKNLESSIELNKLNQVGIELSAETNLDKLLKSILSTCCDITCADGGSIYIVLPAEDAQHASKTLSFELSQSDTLGNRYEKFTLPINKNSIAGYVATTKSILNIKDCYDIPKDAEFKFFDSFDKANNYTTRSMMTVPMINHVDEIIGVIQLINRKQQKNIILSSKEIVEKYVIVFDKKTERLVRSLASQAAVSIENSMLYKELKDIFDSFIQASALAVESRDPGTAGHSRRVSVFSVALAREVNNELEGALKDVKFSEDDLLCMRYAALLHDFGKIGVSEQVLTKSEKLLLSEFENIKARFETIRYYIRENAKDEEAKEKELLKIEEYFSLLEKAKVPGKLSDKERETLTYLAQLKYITASGEVKPYLTDKELSSYLLENGSLTPQERDVIRSHVFHSYKFLDEIPWPVYLRKIPKIAFAHHEMMDGSGYPNKIKSEDIPIEAQILAVSDVFDALIANDRPYKKKISIEDSLNILRKDAEAGKLNKDLVELFIKTKIYEKYSF
jgi:HD-GYP domain-containing protein (c-di-GMP phosphodiesterase class II)